MENSNEDEKTKLGVDAINAFFEQFQPIDNYSIAMIDVVLEMLMEQNG